MIVKRGRENFNLINSGIIALLTFIMLSTILVRPASAQQQPYVGGYLSGSVRTTNRALFSFRYSAPASLLPSSAWLGSVLSVAGVSSGTTPSGWIYQNGAALFKNNSVTWAPQTYFGSQLIYYYLAPNVGSGNSIVFFGRVDYLSDSYVILYRLYAYNSWAQYDNDAPTIYACWHEAWDSGFLVGSRSVSLGQRVCHVRHFQFGVESNQAITGLDWRVTISNTAYYYDNQWRYLPGYSLRGDTAVITWIENTLFGVGGLSYPGVNKEYTSSYSVTWRWIGTTIGDNVLLWSDEGTISNSRKPFQ
ncbi:MAG: hypothetical protein QW702_08430 [Candidatus Bathyarchaeia archaeon]